MSHTHAHTGFRKIKKKLNSSRFRCCVPPSRDLTGQKRGRGRRGARAAPNTGRDPLLQEETTGRQPSGGPRCPCWTRRGSALLAHTAGAGAAPGPALRLRRPRGHCVLQARWARSCLSRAGAQTSSLQERPDVSRLSDPSTTKWQIFRREGDCV